MAQCVHSAEVCSVKGLQSTTWMPGISHELGCVGRKRIGFLIRKRSWKLAGSEVFRPPGFLASPQEGRGNDFRTFRPLTPHYGARKRAKKKVAKSMFLRWKNLKGFLSSEESSTLRPFFSHAFSLLSEAIGAKNRENHFPCSPGGRPGNLGG